MFLLEFEMTGSRGGSPNCGEVQCVGEVSSVSKVSSSMILEQLCKKTDQSHEKLQN